MRKRLCASVLVTSFLAWTAFGAAAAGNDKAPGAGAEFHLARDAARWVLETLDFENADLDSQVLVIEVEDVRGRRSVGELGTRLPPGWSEAKKKRKERPNFTTRQKLNPLFWIGNSDTPEPPEWYRREDPHRKVKWYFRNPGHNFTHYVIGLTDRSDEPEFVRVGLHPDDVFAPQPGWNVAEIRYKGVRLPFVSYWNGRVKWYVGWRQSGNFGIKLNRHRGVEKKP